MANHRKHTERNRAATADDYRVSNYVRDERGKVSNVGAGGRANSYQGVPSVDSASIEDARSQTDAVGQDGCYDSSNEKALLQVRKKRGRKKVLFVVIGVIVALFATSCIAFGVYVNSINDAMKLGDEDLSVKETMTAADFSKPFYMLLVGSDWRENSGITNVSSMTGDQQRADVIMLARVDKPGKKITILTIPRDTPHLKADGSYCKLNEVYNEGRGAALVPAVENLTGIKISHYAEIYFSDFEKIIDSLGGIDIDVPVAIDGTDALTGEPVHIDEGRQHLDGKQAMMYSRERKSFEGNQDEKRQFNIRTVVKAMMKRITQLPLTDLPGVLYSVASCVRTDLVFEDILGLANDFRGGMTMYTGGGPADGNNNEAAGGKWLCYENPVGWERVMRVVDMGEDPGKVTYGGDVCTIAGTDTEVISDGEPARSGLEDEESSAPDSITENSEG